MVALTSEERGGGGGGRAVRWCCVLPWSLEIRGPLAWFWPSAQQERELPLFLLLYRPAPDSAFCLFPSFFFLFSAFLRMGIF
jgi:hypothetical protein